MTSTMNPFRFMDDAEPALEGSCLLKAARLTIAYIDEHGPIGLTPAKALKRHFVAWAAEAFDWPHYRADDLYAVNKVLNEPDFPPLMVLHHVLLSARIARHSKSSLVLTKLGRDLGSRPAQLWTLLATHLLFAIDHDQFTRTSEPLQGNWDIFLNVINIEAQTGITDDQLCALLYGGEIEDIRHDYTLVAALAINVLRPLCWAGLLDEHRTGTGLTRRRIYTKTPLWAAALALDTDRFLQPVTRH